MSAPEIINLDRVQLSASLRQGEVTKKNSDRAVAKLRSVAGGARRARDTMKNATNAVQNKEKDVARKDRQVASLNTQKKSSENKISRLSKNLAQARAQIQSQDTPENFTFVGDVSGGLKVSSDEQDALREKIRNLENALNREKSNLAIIQNNLTSAQNQLVSLRNERDQLSKNRDQANQVAESFLVKQDIAQKQEQTAQTKNMASQERIKRFAEYVEKEGKPVEVPNSDSGKGRPSMVA